MGADATRGTLLVSLIAALALLAWLASRDWSLVSPFSVLAAGAVLAARWRVGENPPATAVIACMYLAPALFIVATGRYRLAFTAIWLAGILATLLPTRAQRGWTVPPRYRTALGMWSLVVAFGWLVVALRELEFDPGFLNRARPGNTSGGVFPSAIVLWVAYVALTQGIGLLWFDWLYRRFAIRHVSFERFVLLPLALSAIATFLLGAYQGFVDQTFLSGGLWPSLGRSTGSFVDANVFGMIAALWSSAFVAVALSPSIPGRHGIAAAGVPLAWIAIWASGSRTAFLAGSTALAFVLHGALAGATSQRTRALALAAVILSAGVATGAAVTLPDTTIGPLRRVLDTLPEPSVESVVAFAREMWNRNYFGLVASKMIEDHPLFGVGLGSFHTLAVDFAYRLTGRLGPDNAQNWYRHQLAELGVIGSVGWMLWCALLIAALARQAPPQHRVRASALRGALVGFGVASLLGVPGQDVAVAITFWTFAFWYLGVVHANAAPPVQALTESRWSRAWSQWVVWALALAYAAGTLQSARHDLRVPFRAARFDFDYSYGFDSRPGPGANRGWTSAHAVVVPPASDQWLKLTVWAEHPDADQRPVQAKVWVDGERVMRYRMPRNVPATKYVRVPGDGKRFVLEARVDRTFRPAGCADASCERGLEMEWGFVKAPPR